MIWLKRFLQVVKTAKPSAKQVHETFLDLVARGDIASLDPLNNLLPQLGLDACDLQQIMPLAERIHWDWDRNANKHIGSQHQQFVDAFVAHINPNHYLCLFLDSLTYDSRMFAQAIAPHLQTNQIDGALLDHFAYRISCLRDDEGVVWWFKLMTPHVEFHRIAAYLIWRECVSEFEILEKQTNLDPGRILTIMMDNGIGGEGQLFERVMQRYNQQQRDILVGEIDETMHPVKPRKM